MFINIIHELVGTTCASDSEIKMGSAHVKDKKIPGNQVARLST